MPFHWFNAQHETILLIEAVKKRRALYIKSHWRYCNEHYKRLEWREVTKTVFAESWEGFSNREKTARIAAVRKRWSYLKAAYNKEVKYQNEPQCVDGNSYTRRPYLYYKDLLFLKSENDNREEDATHAIVLPEQTAADNTATVTVKSEIYDIIIEEAMPQYEEEVITTESPTNPDSNAQVEPDDDAKFSMFIMDDLDDLELNVSVFEPFMMGCRDDGETSELDGKKIKMEIKSEPSSEDD